MVSLIEAFDAPGEGWTAEDADGSIWASGRDSDVVRVPAHGAHRDADAWHG